MNPDDPIHEALGVYATTGDSTALEPIMPELFGAWRSRLRHLAPHATAQDLNDLTQQAIVDLVLTRRDDGTPKAFGSTEVRAPGGWRARVLQRWFFSDQRWVRRRRHAERGLREGWSPATEKTLWRDDKEGVVRPLFEREIPPPEPPRPAEPDAPLLVVPDARQRVLELLPSLTVRRRVLVALIIGADPTPWARELAVELGERARSVLRRMEAATTPPHVYVSGPFSRSILRVLYPEPITLDQALQSARRLLNRAITELRERLRCD